LGCSEAPSRPAAWRQRDTSRQIKRAGRTAEWSPSLIFGQQLPEHLIRARELYARPFVASQWFGVASPKPVNNGFWRPFDRHRYARPSYSVGVSASFGRHDACGGSMLSAVAPAFSHSRILSPFVSR
jgi:hypothetical protein